MNDSDTYELPIWARIVGIFIGILIAIALIIGLISGVKEFNRYQKRADAHNNARVARIDLIRYDALVEQETRKAEVRIEEARGIAESQLIIDSSLTPNYLTYLAIQAQFEMAGSANTTVLYIPAGENGVPLVRDTSGDE